MNRRDEGGIERKTSKDDSTNNEDTLFMMLVVTRSPFVLIFLAEVICKNRGLAMVEPTHYLGSGWTVYHPKGNVMNIYLAGNVGICVCRLHPPNDRYLCLLPTCCDMSADRLATFC
jgi:hypothetical protein